MTTIPTTPFVFLGGTANGSTWRETLKPLLKVAHFDPIVPDWNTEAMWREFEAKKKCEIQLYVFTPEQSGMYGYFEAAVAALRHKPHKAMMVFLIDHPAATPEWQKSVHA